MGSGDPPGLQNRRAAPLVSPVRSTRTRFRQFSMVYGPHNQFHNQLSCLRGSQLNDFAVSLSHFICHHITYTFMVVRISACRISFCCTATEVPTASSHDR